MSAPSSWTTTAGVEAAVRRRWVDGTLLRALAAHDGVPRFSVPLRGPSAVDLGDHLDAAVRWTEGLRRGSRDGGAFDLEFTTVGGRTTGRSAVPVRAVLTRFEQAWRLLGVETEVAAFERVLALSLGDVEASAWVLARPVAAAALVEEWAALLSAHRWLEQNRGGGAYLREVSAPGVDTKCVERHRSVLAPWLGVRAGAADFLDDLGLARKPATVRLRADPALGLLPEGLSEAVLRAGELGAAAIRPQLVLIVENEITYLTVPVPVGGLVLWGRGDDVAPLRLLPWLHGVPVVYWGDLDTHGFRILDRLRAILPQVESTLMDRDTLLAHRTRWGREPDPTTAVLTRLTPDESAVYHDLVSDALGPSVRFEQERVDWTWAAERLPKPSTPAIRARRLVDVVIDDVPEATASELERRAAAEGQTVESLIRARLIDSGSTPG